MFKRKKKHQTSLNFILRIESTPEAFLISLNSELNFTHNFHVKLFRNDLRRVLEESDDNPSTSYVLDTTKSISTTVATTTTSTTTSTTTTTTPPPPPPPSSTTTSTAPSTTESTTKSTTSRTTKRSYLLWKNSDDVPKTPKTYFSNSFSHHNSPNQNNQINGPSTNTKSPFKIVTKRPHEGHDSSSTVPAFSPPTINPFYYGFNRLPRYSTTQASTTSRQQQQYKNNFYTSTTRKNHYNHFTSTKKPDLLAYSSTQATNNEVDNNYQSESPPHNDEIVVVQTEKPKTSSTYNPVFDIYFKQIARQRTAAP